MDRAEIKRRIGRRGQWPKSGHGALIGSIEKIRGAGEIERHAQSRNAVAWHSVEIGGRRVGADHLQGGIGATRAGVTGAGGAGVGVREWKSDQQRLRLRRMGRNKGQRGHDGRPAQNFGPIHMGLA